MNDDTLIGLLSTEGMTAAGVLVVVCIGLGWLVKTLMQDNRRAWQAVTDLHVSMEKIKAIIPFINSGGTGE